MGFFYYFSSLFCCFLCYMLFILVFYPAFLLSQPAWIVWISKIGRATKRKRLLPIQCDKWLTIVYHVMYNAYKVNGQRIILDDDNSQWPFKVHIGSQLRRRFHRHKSTPKLPNTKNVQHFNTLQTHRTTGNEQQQ